MNKIRFKKTIPSDISWIDLYNKENNLSPDTWLKLQNIDCVDTLDIISKLVQFIEHFSLHSKKQALIDWLLSFNLKTFDFKKVVKNDSLSIFGWKDKFKLIKNSNFDLFDKEQSNYLIQNFNSGQLNYYKQGIVNSSKTKFIHSRLNDLIFIKKLKDGNHSLSDLIIFLTNSSLASYEKREIKEDIKKEILKFLNILKTFDYLDTDRMSQILNEKALASFSILLNNSWLYHINEFGIDILEDDFNLPGLNPNENYYKFNIPFDWLLKDDIKYFEYAFRHIISKTDPYDAASLNTGNWFVENMSNHCNHFSLNERLESIEKIVFFLGESIKSSRYEDRSFESHSISPLKSFNSVFDVLKLCLPEISDKLEKFYNLTDSLGMFEKYKPKNNYDDNLFDFPYSSITLLIEDVKSYLDGSDIKPIDISFNFD